MKEPKGESLLAARLARAYPSLSAYSAASLAEELCAIERAQRRHAVRCCSGEDGGYVRLRTRVEDLSVTNFVRAEHDPDAERKAGERIRARCLRWSNNILGGIVDPMHRNAFTMPVVELHHDPRGAVLKIQLPGEVEAVAV